MRRASAVILFGLLVACSNSVAPKPTGSGLAGVWSSTDMGVLHHMRFTLRDSANVVLGEWLGYVTNCSRDTIAICHRDGKVSTVVITDSAITINFNEPDTGNGWSGAVSGLKSGNVIHGQFWAATPTGTPDTSSITLSR